MAVVIRLTASPAIRAAAAKAGLTIEVEKQAAPAPRPAVSPQDAKHARRDRQHHLLIRARQVSPVFVSLDLRPLPLAIGFAAELIDRGLSKKEVRDLLSWWCSRHQYVAALAASGRRFHVDGTDAGEVSETDQAHAAEKLAARKGRASQ